MQRVDRSLYRGQLHRAGSHVYLYSERHDARVTTIDPTLRRTQWRQTYNPNFHDGVMKTMAIHHMEHTVSYSAGALGY